MQVNLFDNPYITKEHAVATAYTDDSYAFGCQTQEASIVMLKNVQGSRKPLSALLVKGGLDEGCAHTHAVVQRV